MACENVLVIIIIVITIIKILGKVRRIGRARVLVILM